MWLLSHKYFSSKKDGQLPSVSGTRLRGRSPLHCRGAESCSIPQPLLQQDQELSCRGPSGASCLSSLHQNTCGDCRDQKETQCKVLE